MDLAPPPWRRLRLWALLLPLVLLLALAGLLRRPGVGPVSRLEPQVLQASRLQDRPTIRSGILVDKVYELDLHSRTFSADGQLWLEWSPDVQHLMDRHGTRPMDLVRLLNRIETWDSTFETASPEPTAPPELPVRKAPR